MKNKLIISLLVLLVFSLQVSAQRKITLSDIYERWTFRQQGVQGINWMNDGKFYTSQEENDIIKYDVTTGNEVEAILRGADLQPRIDFDDYSFSADERKVLLQANTEPIYRRSYKADYFVYDLTSKKLQPLSTKGKQSYATFSPDGTKVAFCRNNDLYMVDLTSMTETQITHDGKWNHIINGSADWVYEEEFSFAKAFFWSPDSKKIAFYNFDESEVEEYNMQMWKNSTLYPIDYKFKYPKAGEENSVVTIAVFDLPTQKTVRMDTGSETDIYIPRIKWTQNPNLLAIQRLNRLQNKMEILHANATTGATNAILTEQSERYIEAEYFDDIVYLKEGKSFIYSSERTGYKHLFLFDMQGKLIRQLTNGNYEVTQFLGANQTLKNPTLYYISTEVSPLERHFYSVDIEGKNKQKLSKEKGTNEVNLSKDFKYYILEHSSVERPLQVSLWQTDKNVLVKKIEENLDLVSKVKDFQLPKKELFSFRNAEGIELFGFMYKPANFDANKKYPVLMHVYGGPSSQSVLDSWGGGVNDLWHQMLTQEGYIIVEVDNRGTLGRGEAFKKATYAQLGKLETQDQIETAKYVGNLPYVDKTRIGIWGWSYGGYMTSLCMTLGADFFKAGIAVAPVTNWRLYDTIYTERFLKRPQDNPSGYDDYSPVTHAGKLKGAYLLVHGTGDDNVHFQNAIIMQNALIRAGKQFQSFYYPDRNHGIYGGNTRMHLYQMMTEFVLKNL